MNMLYCDKNVSWFKIYDDKILFETSDIKNLEISHKNATQNLELPNENTENFIISKSTISIFYSEFNVVNELIFNFEFDKIIKIEFFYDNYLLILYSLNKKNSLILYNIDTFEYSDLCPFFSVTDFDVDTNSLEIFLCYFENNSSQIVKIDKDLNEYYLESILGNILKIVLKKTF